MVVLEFVFKRPRTRFEPRQHVQFAEAHPPAQSIRPPPRHSQLAPWVAIQDGIELKKCLCHPIYTLSKCFERHRNPSHGFCIDIEPIHTCSPSGTLPSSYTLSLIHISEPTRQAE